jgi:hypothetical protein
MYSRHTRGRATDLALCHGESSFLTGTLSRSGSQFALTNIEDCLLAEIEADPRVPIVPHRTEFQKRVLKCRK